MTALVIINARPAGWDRMVGPQPGRVPISRSILLMASFASLWSVAWAVTALVLSSRVVTRLSSAVG